MKILALVTALLIPLTALQETKAACIPHGVAESAVSGRKYVLEKSPTPETPTYLTFGDTSTLTASFGSALDGKPAGDYHYRGNCHGEVIVTFTSHLGTNPQPKELFHLRPSDRDYFTLKSANGDDVVFKIVVD